MRDHGFVPCISKQVLFSLDFDTGVDVGQHANSD